MKFKSHRDLPTTVELIILSILDVTLSGPWAVTDLRDRFQHIAYDATRNTIMLALRNMESKKLVNSKIEVTRPKGLSGPPRVLFSISRHGRNVLDYHRNALSQRVA